MPLVPPPKKSNTAPDLAIPDRVLVAGRWIAAFVGIVSSLPAAERADQSLAYASAWIIGIATWRTVRPFERMDNTKRRVWLVFELLTTAVAVAVSGAWASPFTSSLIVVTLLAAMSEDLVGAWLAILGLLVTVLAIGYASDTQQLVGADFARLFTTIAVAAVVGVAVRRAFTRLRSQAITQIDELQRLADTNALMVRLTKLTRAGETIREPRDIAIEAASRFAVSFQTARATVLHRSDQGDEWLVLADHFGNQAVSLTESNRPSPTTYLPAVLVAVLGDAVVSGQGLTDVDPFPGTGGLDGNTSPTLVAPVLVRNEVIGAVVFERAPAFTGEERQRLASMCEVLGLSIDNSRWFRRLRSMGAEDERSRIARELHDRLASSVAYSAFAFERLRQHYTDDKDLAKAHDEARITVGELRDLLWQLRTGVTAASPFSVVGVDLARRFSNRTGIQTTFTVAQEARLPFPVEMELLRITQEALNNVEKHAQATDVTIVYEPAIPTTRLTIRDNGVGFNPDSSVSSDSFGLSGIRERADVIGATVQITSRSAPVRVGASRPRNVDGTTSADDELASGTTIELTVPSDESMVTLTTVEPSVSLDFTNGELEIEIAEQGSPAQTPTVEIALSNSAIVLTRKVNGDDTRRPATFLQVVNLNGNPTESGHALRELPIEQNVRSMNHENPVRGTP